MTIQTKAENIKNIIIAQLNNDNLNGRATILTSTGNPDTDSLGAVTIELTAIIYFKAKIIIQLNTQKQVCIKFKSMSIAEIIDIDDMVNLLNSLDKTKINLASQF